MKNLIKNIKKYFFPPKPVYTQEYIDHPSKQIMETKCFKNGKYTHTVNLHYFTQEQVDKLQNIDTKQRIKDIRKQKLNNISEN